MSSIEVAGLIVAAVVAAAGVCWLAVAIAVHRVRRQRPDRRGGVRAGGV